MASASLRGQFAAALFGEAAPDKLPRRVVEAIRRQQNDSEILVSWIQTVIIIAWGALYFLGPKAFPADVPFRPVPWVLGAYAALTAIRLLLAHARLLTGPLVAGSILIDMAMLMGLIWSFHLQYGQPPSFYLKAPTLLYVFVFIGLRTLRFDSAYVLMAGAAAALGWIVLLGYSLWGQDMDSLVTRNYVEYLTSNRILRGAEFDKIISIVMVALVLGLAVARSRRLLLKSIAEQTATMELSRFFAPEIAKAIAGAEQALQPGEGELRQAAAMFIDLRGFTRLSQTLEPRELVQLLGEYQGRVVPIVQKHNGSVTTYLGDGIMITFGAVRRTETYAADALRAAEELIDTLNAWAEQRRAAGLPAPGVGIGVYAGTVMYGVIGDQSRLEYAIIGDTVNRAAKLQNQTKAEAVQALTACVCRDLAVSQGYDPRRAQRELRARAVAGVGEPMDLAVIA
jgi:adenylate cyclase